MRIYVGKLSSEVTEDELRLAFEEFGQVESTNIIIDKYSGESKGYGFVEMPSKEEGQSAIDNLNGRELKGRNLNVNEARPRTDNRGGRGSYSGDKGKRGFGRDRGKGSSRGGYGGGGRSRRGDR